jgi:hypothetical protein
MKRDFLRELANEFRACGEPTPAIAAAMVMGHVAKINPDEHEIKRLLILMFEVMKDVGVMQGKKLGAQAERETNPMLRGAGDFLNDLLERQKKELAVIFDKVFQFECERGSNPFFAHSQALKAVGEYQPKKG